MSRMPMHVLYSFRYAFRASVFVVAIAIFSLSSSIAHADPHAVFYTDRAQEQVFFNTLAALNQADFVEPGLNDGTENNRTRLLEKRTQESKNIQTPPTSAPGQAPTDFTGYENPLVASTKTNLPGVVSRNITLEGNDLWTAYLVNQLTLETKTRRSISELARIYCTGGLGREGCSTNPGTSQHQSSAFINDSATYNPESLALIGGLSDGAQGEEDLRNNLTDTGIGSPQYQIGQSGPAHPGPINIPESLKVPRPSFPDIEQLRKNNKDENLNLVNNVISGIMSSFFYSAVDPNALKNITVKADGTAELPKDISSDDYMARLSGIGSILHGSITASEVALQEGLKAQENRSDTKSLADTILTKDSGGAVKAIIKAPSTAKEALIQEGAALLSNSTINQKSVAPQEITNPGTTSLISEQQRVLGASTRNDSSQSNGRVAGIISELYKQYYGTSEQSSTDLNTASRPPFEEGGLYEELQSLTGDAQIRDNPSSPTSENYCGFCVAVDTITGAVSNSATQNALDIVQGVYNDIYCTFRPQDDPACKALQI